MNRFKKWILLKIVIPWDDYWMRYQARKRVRKYRKILHKLREEENND